MKIKQDHYKAILDAIRSVAEFDPTYARRARAAGHSDNIIQWDMFRCARIEGDTTRWVCKTLYPYMNDAHIDTALSKAFRDLDVFNAPNRCASCKSPVDDGSFTLCKACTDKERSDFASEQYHKRMIRDRAAGF